MSDVQDWTGVSAGATQLLASGGVNGVSTGPSYRWTIPLASVPQTTRSLIAILQSAATNPGAVTLTQATLLGAVTNLQWASLADIPAGERLSSLNPGDTATPLYMPFYGQVDGSGTLTINGTGGGRLNYWVLALPDADLLGSNPIPVAVTNSNWDTGPPANAVPLVVQPGAGYGAHTLYQVTAATSTTTALLAAPDAGMMWEVVMLGVSAPTTAASVAQAAQILGHTTTHAYLIRWPSATGIAAEVSGTFYISEGLDINNAAVPVTVTARALARQITAG